MKFLNAILRECFVRINFNSITMTVTSLAENSNLGN